MTTPNEPRSAGRPTKYDPDYCEQVLEVMGTGLSLTAFAGVVGVARSTINEWLLAHPDFAAAVRVGQAKRVYYLERSMLDGDIGARITSRIFALKNADPEEWRDRRELEHSGNVTIGAMLDAIDG